VSNKTQRSNSKLIILALILLVPGFLYIAVNRLGSNQYVSLPIFGEKSLSGEMKRNWGREYPDTIYHTVPAVKFLDASGNSILFPAQDSCVSVVHLFYTQDSSFSRLITDKAFQIADKFKENPYVKVYSISVSPKDNKFTVDAFITPYRSHIAKNWNVLYGSSVDIFSYARKSLLIDAMSDPTDSERFLISNKLVLLDSKSRLRGFYDSSLKGEIDRLEDEIKLLMVEEIRNRPAKLKLKQHGDD